MPGVSTSRYYEAHARRRLCLDAALLRFVTPTETAQVQYNKPKRKRQTRNDAEIVKQTLLKLCGNDSWTGWTPLLCGHAHKLKRPKLELCSDFVRNAILPMVRRQTCTNNSHYEYM